MSSGPAQRARGMAPWLLVTGLAALVGQLRCLPTWLLVTGLAALVGQL